VVVPSRLPWQGSPFASTVLRPSTRTPANERHTQSARTATATALDNAPRLLAITAGIAAFPAILFAIEHPTAAVTALLSFGAVATAVRVA